MIPSSIGGTNPLANAIPAQLPASLVPPVAGVGDARPNGIMNGVMPNPMRQPMHQPIASASPFMGARGLGILNMLQQRNPALLARLQARFPQFGAGGIPPAFGMGRFPYGGSHQMTPYA